jgi:hypothetical protein
MAAPDTATAAATKLARVVRIAELFTDAPPEVYELEKTVNPDVDMRLDARLNHISRTRIKLSGEL